MNFDSNGPMRLLLNGEGVGVGGGWGAAETFDADAFTASLADELGVDAATLSTEVVDSGPGDGISVVVSGAPAAAAGRFSPIGSLFMTNPPRPLGDRVHQ